MHARVRLAIGDKIKNSRGRRRRKRRRRMKLIEKICDQRSHHDDSTMMDVAMKCVVVCVRLMDTRKDLFQCREI